MANSKIKENLYKPYWQKKGITIVGDLIDMDTGNVTTKEEFENNFNYSVKTFWNIYARNSVRKFIIQYTGG